MNPQPTHSTTNFFTALFLALILYFMLKGDKSKTLKSFDMLELGYSYDIPRQTYSQPLSYNINFQNVQPKKSKTRKKKQLLSSPTLTTFEEEIEQTRDLQTTPTDEDKLNTIRALAKDCYDTLVAIGYKKREAKKLVEEYFKKNPNPDITQFIKDITFKA